jgi:hypothetical protein
VRLLLLALVLAVPLAAAEPAPTIRQCTQLGCAIVQDVDGDGSYEWASWASAVGEQIVLNAVVNGSNLLYEAGITSEELPAAEPYREAWLVGEANTTGGVQHADALLYVAEGNEETGERETIVWQYVVARDTDGDGAPDEVETVPTLP